MTTVHALVNGRRHVIDLDDASDRAGAGGEAVVKIIGGKAVKIYFQYDPDRAEKLRNAPTNTPSGATMPEEFVYDANDPTRVIGIVMPLVQGVPISMFGDADFQKDHGLTWRKLVRILLNLCDLVIKIHKAGIVLGDFNEKNVLVNTRTLEVFIVDMDSAEWGTWKTRTYTLEFTAPELLVASTVPNDPPVMKDDACYSEETDWYAVAVMVCKVLLGGTPYRDGVHQPNGGEVRMFLNRRVLNRISFFGSNVKLPPEVHHPSSLPAGLGLFLYDVFVQDRRETPFPRQFLETFDWMTCPSCKTTHGRTTCPKCGAAGVTTPTTPYFKPGTKPTNGGAFGPVFLAAAPHKDTVQYLRYEDGKYCREDGSIVLRRNYSPSVSALIAGTRTVLVTGQKFAIINGARRALTQYYATQRVFGRTTVAANSRHVYWMSGNHLVRDDSLRGIASIGSAIPHETSVWVGERFGVALMQAGTLTSVMTFNDTGYTGRYDIHDLSPHPSAIVDAQCVISESHAWLTVTREDGTTKPYVFNATAQMLATATGQCGVKTGINYMKSSSLAVGDKIMVPISGSGIVRFGILKGTIQQDGTIPCTATPEDTVKLVLSPTGLLQVTHTQLQPILSIS